MIDENGDPFISNICLLPMITENEHYLLKLYNHYKAGNLAISGGVIDQPNYYLDAMELISLFDEVNKNK